MKNCYVFFSITQNWKMGKRYIFLLIIHQFETFVNKIFLTSRQISSSVSRKNIYQLCRNEPLVSVMNKFQHFIYFFIITKWGNGKIFKYSHIPTTRKNVTSMKCMEHYNNGNSYAFQSRWNKISSREIICL